MTTGLRKMVAAALAAVLITGLASSATAAPERTELRQAMDELIAAGGAGVQVRVHDSRGNWVGAAGTRELGRHLPVTTDGRYRAGSITKTFVATVVLQLAGEGRLRLDDPVNRYLPRLRLDKRITVRMLLQHTSGLFNYTGEPGPDGTLDPGIPVDGQEFVDRRYHTYRPVELVRMALAKPARFEPGTSWSYSNTNYVLAGMLIEQVTGTSYATQVRRRILSPLGLRNTVFPGTRSGIPGPHAHGYYGYLHKGTPKLVDITRLNPSYAGASGEMVSTTKDLDRFLAALLGGELLPWPLLKQMLTTMPIGGDSAYGLGIGKRELGCGAPLFGHTGDLIGNKAYLFGTADNSVRVEISLTQGALPTDDPNALLRYSQAAEKLFRAVACGTKVAAPDVLG